jgi:hydrogenase-4 component E
MTGLAYDVAHLLAGTTLLMSFALLYQRRLSAVVKVFAIQGLVIALAAAWQAYVQSATHLYLTAAIAFGLKTVVIPVALNRIIRRLGIHRTIETALGIAPTMLAGVALVALTILLVLPIAAGSALLTREIIAIALAVVLLGLLMMITRRNAVTQVIGFMSLENGLILAAVGVQGMPLVVEMSVAFSVLVAFLIFGVFFFQIRERFDSLELHYLEDARDRGP